MPMRQRDWITYGTPATSEKRGMVGEKKGKPQPAKASWHELGRDPDARCFHLRLLSEQLPKKWRIADGTISGR